jgi:hypothetical protein
MSLRLGVKPKAQSLINQNGHFYDRLEVIDPKTNATQYVWFNADIQMNPDGLAVPGSTKASKSSAAPAVVATTQTIAPVLPIPNGTGIQLSRVKDADSKADASDDQLHTVESQAPPSEPQTLYDQGGVSIIATETQLALELAVSEPDPIFVSVEVDRNQNQQFDCLVDVAYRPQRDGSLCPQYLIDSEHNTPCGRFASVARLKNFKDEHGQRQFVLELPKREISLDQPSAKLAFVIRNNAQRNTSFYPVERFQKAIDIPYTIKQRGATQADQPPLCQHR